MLLNKKLRLLFVVLLSFMTLSTFNACEKDDENIEPKKEETPKKEEKPKGENNEEGEGDISEYSVNGRKITKTKDYTVTGDLLKLQKDTKQHTEVWELVSKVVPDNFTKFFNEYVVFAGEKNGTAGYVSQTTSDLTQWVIGIAIDFAYEGGFNKDGELAYTIIHEFGHVVTLNNTQVDSKIAEKDSKTFFTGEGAVRKNSYINTIFQKFWKDVYKEFQAVGDDETKSEAFYEKYKDRFVTKYASTNPGEDIAEIFTHFVIKDKPTGNTIANKKVKLFYEYPDLIKLRNHIRKSLKIGTKSKSAMNVKVWKRGATIGKKGQKR